MHAAAPNTKAPEIQREKRVVLVVDGDTVSQFYTTIVLQRLHYHVFPVRNAEEALMIMELSKPLLVITEIALPQMSGVDLLKLVKRDPRTRDIPVLIYTAVKAEAQRDACRSAGCAGYLVHTSDHNLLYEAVQKATEPTPRHFVRLATWLDVIVTAPGGKNGTALVTAISEHGMFVSTEKPLPQGATAEFVVHLPNAGNNGISLRGKILYSHAGSSGKGPGMGVKFSQVRPEDSALMKAFIEEKLMDGLAKTGQTTPK